MGTGEPIFNLNEWGSRRNNKIGYTLTFGDSAGLRHFIFEFQEAASGLGALSGSAFTRGINTGQIGESIPF